MEGPKAVEQWSAGWTNVSFEVQLNTEVLIRTNAQRTKYSGLIRIILYAQEGVHLGSG